MKCSCGHEIKCPKCGKEPLRSLEELWRAAANGEAHRITPQEEMAYGILSPPRWRHPTSDGETCQEYCARHYREYYGPLPGDPDDPVLRDLKEWDG